MLNYIWAGLIVFSFAFALVNDVRDLRRDTYRNGKPLPVQVEQPPGGGSAVKVVIDPATYRAHYGLPERASSPGPLSASLLTTDRGRELRFDKKADLPPTLAKVRDATAGVSRSMFAGSEPNALLALVTNYESPAGASATQPASVPAEIQFPPVRWASMQSIGSAAIGFSMTAVEIALGLIGTLTLFLGTMQIAEKAGLINAVVRVPARSSVRCFPGIPKGHPAMGMVTLNLTANMLGLGNAATPFGIKAMEELQKLNRTTDTATNSMVMLLAMNTAGVQLLPPVFLYGVLGLRASELYVAILVVTGLALVVAIVSTKLLGMLPAYRRSDPDRLPVAAAAGDSAEVAR
jgi:spore maturation protein A